MRSVRVEGQWDKVEKAMTEVATTVCGITKGKCRQRETWWWYDEVEKAVETKRQKLKEWKKAEECEKDMKQAEYKALRNEAKRYIARIQAEVMKKQAETLNSKEGTQNIFRIAKQKKKERKDITGTNCLKGDNGELLVFEEQVLGRWREYFLIIVMEAVTHNLREGLPWEMLYADDLILVGKHEEEMKEKLRKWNECLKDNGLKINEDKTKVMCESFGTAITQVIGNVKHPCSVCLKGVGVNSIRCTQCIQWVHARCSRVKDSLKNIESSFICRRCKGELCETRQINSQVNGLHIDGNEYDIVDKLCYFGDMLSPEGGCEHATLKRIQTGWLKFRELSGLLIGRGMSLKSKGIIYITCVRPAMLYGSETWPTKIEDIRKMQRSEMRMLRWMEGVSLSERKSNECVRSMLAIDDIGEVM